MNKKETVFEQTKEMEQCFLGSLLSTNERINTRLKAADFYNANHEKIFETIYKLWDNGTTPDIQTVSNELRGQVDASLIAELTSIIPSAANIDYYENEVFEARKIRLLGKSTETFNTKINDPSLTEPEKENAIKDLITALAGVTAARNETIIKNAADLLQTVFPEIKWIIPGLIGEGLTMIYGAPKIGKSWFILNLAIAAAAGGKFLGKLDAKKTETLYLALEDTDRRINSRLKLLKVQSVDIQNLKIATQWRDSYTGLEHYLKANKGIGLVIIDTLARFANIQDFNKYEETTAAGAKIKRIADDLGISIVVIHHAKKTGGREHTDWTEKALGSTGLTGATDATILIERKDRKSVAVLYATGRDTADIQKHLEFDITLKGWNIKDKPETTAKPGKKEAPEDGDKEKRNYGLQ